ncbi:MAG: zinc ribbon domain-containing protein [Actinomycetota bacterium]|nr:zinc ribbon domain-containing protein [Actinomycetota bacterium]
MPTYAYRCPTCDETFDRRRPMSESSEPAVCPEGHEGARRLLSVFASVGSGATSSSESSSEPVQWTGRDGCGGGCACH